MKSQRTREEFIELRSRGMAYVAISAELGVSRQTLARWDKLFSTQIQERREHEDAILHTKYVRMKEHRILVFLQQLERIRDELSRRDLSTVTTPELLRLFLSFCSAIRSEVQSGQTDIATDQVVTIRRWEEILLQVTGAEDQKRNEVSS